MLWLLIILFLFLFYSLIDYFVFILEVTLFVRLILLLNDFIILYLDIFLYRVLSFFFLGTKIFFALFTSIFYYIVGLSSLKLFQNLKNHIECIYLLFFF